MLKRKQYHTKREIKRDQIAGFITFFVVIGLAFLFRYLTREYSSTISGLNIVEANKIWLRSNLEGLGELMPYIAFFGALAWSFYLRFELGVGFVMAVAFCIAFTGIYLLVLSIVLLLTFFIILLFDSFIGTYFGGITMPPLSSEMHENTYALGIIMVMLLYITYRFAKWSIPQMIVWWDDSEGETLLLRLGMGSPETKKNDDVS
ncbi:MAG: hypothetical protein OT477_23885 [Chloroflexi bacterium]|nr:hypothetical protein [Chloroflexota bacterium]